MTKLILLILIYSTLLCSSDKSSSSLTLNSISDTLKISELVEKQIQSAREKQLQFNDNSAGHLISVPDKEKSEIEQVHKGSGYSFIQDQPLHIQLFGICTIAVILFVLIRRSVFILKRKLRHEQKEKIQLLREEKITSSLSPKLRHSRKGLRNSEVVIKGSEKNISRAAKDLKIAKGELVLAARLKLFEIGKM